MSEAISSAARNAAAGPERPEKHFPLWQRLCISQALLTRSAAHKVAYIGIMAALCIVVNTFEIKFADT